jgi:tRNA (guanine37-N1)-methyltransferase
MNYKILTLFPDIVDMLKYSIIGRAVSSGALNISATDIRKYSLDKHHKCDDTPYGGGPGMLMTAQPIYDCIQAVDPDHKCRRVFMTPVGTRLDDAKARDLAAYNDILLLCGHYEGVDQRVIDLSIDECISIGDYVLTGGELAALVLIDAVSRYQGVLGSQQSTIDESFVQGLLEYPQYTRPQVFMQRAVPDVLLSGNHAEIAKWRRLQALATTKKHRPDLL